MSLTIGSDIISTTNALQSLPVETITESVTQSVLASVKSNILETIFPVNSLYTSLSNTDPSEVLGFGTWTKIKDKFLLASGDSYKVNSTGGEATHTLTTDEMPTHRHVNCIYNTNNNNYNMTSSAIRLTKANGDQAYEWIDLSKATDITTAGGDGGDPCGKTYTTGGSAAHNNMPPYLCVNIWQRTA